MELRAVIASLKHILKLSKTSNNSYEIFSDSAYVINVIKQGWIKAWQGNNWITSKKESVKNKDMWEKYIDLSDKLKSKNIKITFTKVKGHAGNVFNEHVDYLAKQGVIEAAKKSNC